MKTRTTFLICTTQLYIFVLSKCLDGYDEHVRSCYELTYNHNVIEEKYNIYIKRITYRENTAGLHIL